MTDVFMPDRYQPNAPTKLILAAIVHVRDADDLGLWTFAKTMPHIPHEYTVRQRSKAAGLGPGHEALWVMCRDFHIDRWWGGRTWRTIDLDGWAIWAVDDGMILNRRAVDDAGWTD